MFLLTSRTLNYGKCLFKQALKACLNKHLIPFTKKNRFIIKYKQQY